MGQTEEIETFILVQLRKSIRAQVARSMTEVLGAGDVMMLSAFDIDVGQKILDIFIEECRAILGKKESSDAGPKEPA